MNKATIFHNGAGITITAPEGKEMVFDGSMLQHGILTLGEFGQSGIKIAAFHKWDYAYFLSGGEGYTITNTVGGDA